MTTPRKIACQELVELLTDYLEGALPPSEAAAVQAHLDPCAHCTRYLDQLRVTIDALGRFPPPRLSDEACDVLLDAFRER